MIRFSSLLLILAIAQLSWAQISSPGIPVSAQEALPAPLVAEMPAIDVRALLAEDVIDQSYNLPLRFAFGHSVDLDLNNSGVWTELRGGDRVWRLSIHCPEALNINLLYSDFLLPAGAELYLYNKDASQLLGAFTEKNNKDNRRFATALIHGENLTLEYYEPASVRGQGSIKIAQVSHGYRNLDGSTDEKVSGDCQVNVNCEEGADWQNEKKGVARILMDGLYLCSGSLVTNTANDCKPLFLTANHCLMGGIKQDAIINPDVSGYVFYWNYEYASCANSGSLPEQTTSGGTVLANAGLMETGTHTLLSSDFALIELDENPRGSYDVYFNGWDATGEQGNTGVGIHHPAGDAKKISTHSVIPEFDGYYWALYWDPTQNGHSVTEGGSSGSALFRENGVIIGQLFGGGSVNCDDPANDLALYGQLSYSWTNSDDLLTSDPRRRLNTWLDPIGQGSIRSMGGTYDPCEVPKVYFKTVATTVSEEDASLTEGCRSYKNHIFEMGITPYPTQPVNVQIFVDGDADSGESMDYELLSNTLTFNNVTNTQTFEVRVYDDVYPEDAEFLEFTFVANGTNGLQVGSMSANDELSLEILSTDEAPANHVQTVRNTSAPAEEYLGPFGTVYFTDPGSDGMMLMLQNESSHDYGCVSVMVDNAGGTANNSWATGTTLSKTLRIITDNPASAPLQASLYIDDGELAGWQWFNNGGWNAEDARVYQFAGNATNSNEGTATELTTAFVDYGSEDTRLNVQLAGLTNNTTGFAMGRLSAAAAGNNAQLTTSSTTSSQLAPNLTRDRSTLRWMADIDGETTIRVVDAQGRTVAQYQPYCYEGYNSLELDAEAWTSGLYFVQLIQDGKQVEVQRLIKQ